MLMNRKAVKGRFVSQLDCKTFPHSVLSPCCWRIPWNWDRESLVPEGSWWRCPGCLWVVEVGLVQWPVVLKRIRCRRPHHRCHRPPVPRAIYSSASPTLCSDSSDAAAGGQPHSTMHLGRKRGGDIKVSSSSRAREECPINTSPRTDD